jgi:pimeloyl-ACP methyl ester carboxylesterase
MIPVRFGSESREMLGFYHAPAQAVPGAPAVLICNAFGQEMLRSYRMLRLLADRLSSAGCAVLRFDYFGTGDSPGDDDAASVAGWAGDIGSAHRELSARAARSSVVWVGVRLGASLCALAARSAKTPLQKLVMWDPVINGSEYLEALGNESHGSSAAHGHVATMGFTLSDRFRNELRGLNLATLDRLNAAQATIIVGSESPATQQLREALSRSTIAPDWNVSAAAAQWNSDKAMNTATVPADLLKLVQTKVMEPA